MRNLYNRALLGAMGLAMVFGLFQVPIAAAAVHASFGHEGPVGAVHEDHVADEETQGSDDCTQEDCSPQAACLKHCIEAASAHTGETVAVPQISTRLAVDVPRTVHAIAPHPLTPPKEVLQRRQTGARLLTTQRRE